jgi:hypothetical protein
VGLESRVVLDGLQDCIPPRLGDDIVSQIDLLDVVMAREHIRQGQGSSVSEVVPPQQKLLKVVVEVNRLQQGPQSTISHHVLVQVVAVPCWRASLASRSQLQPPQQR